MDNFTCISCRVAFKDSGIQRLHYKSDWHRYNLKRKVAELPPITAEEFQRRVLSHKEVVNLPEKSLHCNVCRKSFSSQNAFDNHLNSKRHRDGMQTLPQRPERSLDSSNNKESTNIRNSRELESEADSDEWEDDEDNNIFDTKCLFCSCISETLVNNIKHMSEKHSFFIPDVEYCINIQDLLFYLGSKIEYGFMCIWCNDKGRTFHSAEAARNHMLDKGHCKMLHEGITLAEYAEYYDYSSSYPDYDEQRDHTEDSEAWSPTVLDDGDYQLILPSGATIGHRTLMRYYKQNIDPTRSATILPRNRKLNKILVNYQALGWNAVAQQELVAKKIRDLRYMNRMQNKCSMKLGIKGNKLQHHYRERNTF